MSDRLSQLAQVRRAGRARVRSGPPVRGAAGLPGPALAQEAERGRPPARQVKHPDARVQPLSDLSDAFAAVAEAVRPSVVYIHVEADRDGRRAPAHDSRPDSSSSSPSRPRAILASSEAAGRASSSRPDGYILTNNHVVEGADKVEVQPARPARVHRQGRSATDPHTDVGVLKIDAKGLTPAALGESSKARVGEWVLAMGNPLGAGLTFTVTSGIISAKGRGGWPGEPGTTRRRAASRTSSRPMRRSIPATPAARWSTSAAR